MQTPFSRELPPESSPAAQPIPPLPFLTAILPGIDGRLKECVRDFEVEEVPAYLPSGEGEHLFLWIEKEDVAAEQLTQHIARGLGISSSEVGVAGMKDRRAVARQYVSVPARHEPFVQDLGTDRIRILEARRHGNKLRTGHLKGNRFSILVRGVHPDALLRANDIVPVIRRTGFPNYFGRQRYGREGETLSLGWRLLKGSQTARDIPGHRRKFLLRLALSSVQSALFDELLTERLAEGLIDRMLPGDVLQVVESGGVFVVEDPAAEQDRFDRQEIVATGAMFGPKMKLPTGEAAARESRVLERHDIALDAFSQFPKLTSGTRRPFVVHAEDLHIEAEEDGLRFRFTLPSGVYATTLLREFMKNDLPVARG